MEPLALSLEKPKEIEEVKNQGNIIQNITTAFGQAVDKGVDLLPLSAETADMVKSGIKNFDYGDLAGKAIEAALKTGMQKLGISSNTFQDLKQIKNAVVAGDVKKGLSSVINIVIDQMKFIPKSAKTVLKEGKDVILGDAFDKELDHILQKQRTALSRIDKNCEKWDKALQKQDKKELEKLTKSLQKDLDKVMPIKEVLDRATSRVNQFELLKNKENISISELEKELCQKVG